MGIPPFATVQQLFRIFWSPAFTHVCLAQTATSVQQGRSSYTQPLSNTDFGTAALRIHLVYQALWFLCVGLETTSPSSSCLPSLLKTFLYKPDLLTLTTDIPIKSQVVHRCLWGKRGLELKKGHLRHACSESENSLLPGLLLGFLPQYPKPQTGIQEIVVSCHLRLPLFFAAGCRFQEEWVRSRNFIPLCG